MNNPGIYSLTQLNGSSDIAVTTAGTTVCDVIDNLDGMTAVSLQLRLAYGTGGTTVRAYVQTSLDQGTTWIDIACALFGTASETEVINLSGLTPKTTQAQPTDGALPDDTSLDGVLGDRLRVKAVSTGTYANTVLSARASVR
ncbi:MAG TPA: hypothetical protein VND94_00980 [Terriglobia bacterium]|nr:hypothetical protein [Terriglobia bacterium]